MTLAATLATAPLLALHFERVSPVSLPANLAAAARGRAGDVARDARRGRRPALTPALAAPLNVAQRRPARPTSSGSRTPPPRCRSRACPARLPGALRRSPLDLRRALGGGGRSRCARPGGGTADWRPPAAPGRGDRPEARRAGLRVAAVDGRRDRASPRLRRAAAAPASRRPGRARGLVPRRRAGRRDAAAARRGGDAGRHRAARTARSCERLAEARVERLDALVLTHAEADHEGAALKVLRALPAAAAGQRRRGLARARCSGRWPRRSPRGVQRLARSRRGRRARGRGDADARPLAAAADAPGFAADGDPNDLRRWWRP